MYEFLLPNANVPQIMRIRESFKNVFIVDK